MTLKAGNSGLIGSIAKDSLSAITLFPAWDTTMDRRARLKNLHAGIELRLRTKSEKTQLRTPHSSNRQHSFI